MSPDIDQRRMPSVFLSYSREDSALAALIEEQLESHGVAVWRDQESLRAGQHWPKALGEAIEASDAFLLLWSGAAARSAFVEFEWNTALALKKQMLPCLVDHTPLPPSLVAVQTLSLGIVSEVVDSILIALHKDPVARPQARVKEVTDRLAGIRSTEPSEVLNEFLAVHGSVFQVSGDVHIGTPSPPKTTLDKSQAWVAILVGVLTAVSLGFALWHSYAPTLSRAGTQQRPSSPVQRQAFAGSVWSSKNEPISGVKVSLLLDEKLLGSGVTDELGRFSFNVPAAPEAEITLVAQKDGFQTETRYTHLGNTGFNFTIRERLK